MPTRVAAANNENTAVGTSCEPLDFFPLAHDTLMVYRRMRYNEHVILAVNAATHCLFI
jgi:hypothetical protein